VETRKAGRGLEIATAVALGVVSIVTALGALQAGLWNDAAQRFADDSADARDQSIAIAVVAQLRQRADLAAVLEAKSIAGDYEAALAAGDYDLAVELAGELGAALGNSFLLPDGSFDAWYESGWSDEAIPTEQPDYLVELRGDADALILASQELGSLAEQLKTRSAVLGQAALVHALALFLFGVAGINRLRLARLVTLGMGVLVFLFGLFLMSTAY